MSLTLEIKTILASIPNTFIGNMPISPDNANCIYNTGGFSRSLTETQIEQPTFQIKVRNLSYPTGETVCNQIKNLLHGHGTQKVLVIEQMGDILDIGRDANNRQEFTMNFKCYYIQ